MARNSSACLAPYSELREDIEELSPLVDLGIGEVEFLYAGTGLRDEAGWASLRECRVGQVHNAYMSDRELLIHSNADPSVHFQLIQLLLVVFVS